MSRTSRHDLGAFIAYGQACGVLEQVDAAQADAFPMPAALVAEFRGIREAAAAEIREIGALREARKAAAA